MGVAQQLSFSFVSGQTSGDDVRVSEAIESSSSGNKLIDSAKDTLVEIPNYNGVPAIEIIGPNSNSKEQTQDEEIELVCCEALRRNSKLANSLQISSYYRIPAFIKDGELFEGSVIECSCVVESTGLRRVKNLVVVFRYERDSDGILWIYEPEMKEVDDNIIVYGQNSDY